MMEYSVEKRISTDDTFPRVYDPFILLFTQVFTDKNVVLLKKIPRSNEKIR